MVTTVLVNLVGTLFGVVLGAFAAWSIMQASLRRTFGLDGIADTSGGAIEMNDAVLCESSRLLSPPEARRAVLAGHARALVGLLRFRRAVGRKGKGFHQVMSDVENQYFNACLTAIDLHEQTATAINMSYMGGSLIGQMDKWADSRRERSQIESNATENLKALRCFVAEHKPAPSGG